MRPTKMKTCSEDSRIFTSIIAISSRTLFTQIRLELVWALESMQEADENLF